MYHFISTKDIQVANDSEDEMICDSHISEDNSTWGSSELSNSERTGDGFLDSEKHEADGLQGQLK